MDSFESLLVNNITLLDREEITYENGIANTKFTELGTHKARISSLNYKDLQFLDKVQDTQNKTLKMYCMLDCNIEVKDKIKRKDEIYKVISKYTAQDRNGSHHLKFYIQKYE